MVGALPFLSAFLVVLCLGPWTISLLRQLNMRQSVGANSPQPEAHRAKHGTPTMGGVLFALGIAGAIVAGCAVGAIPADRWDSAYSTPPNTLWAVCAVFVLHMGLGFLDDYLKATRGKALKLKARQKLGGQIAIAVLFAIYLGLVARPGVTSTISVWRGLSWDVSPWLYYPFVVLLMVGLSNGVNIADGLDGLASGLAMLCAVGLALAVFSAYQSVAYFAWALAGSCLGFLVYNGNPARVIMGDTGSLALGAGLAAVAVLGKLELPLLVFAVVFIAEGLSVVIQVISFKSTGKRVFKMAPLHHHFELLGGRNRRSYCASGLPVQLHCGQG